ncbi:MAG: diguanylate cyclase domain-containing protein [Nitrospinaceae bacterium]
MKDIKETLHFIMADDDPDDILLVRELIREGMSETQVEVEGVPHPEDLDAHLSQNSYDLCFLDYRLGSGNGLEILESLRENHPHLPVIMLTGQGDQKIAVEAMKQGATDYVIKGQLEPVSLAHAVRRALTLQEETHHRERVEKALAAQGKLLEANSEATFCLLTHQEHPACVDKALAIMGQKLQAEHIFLFMKKGPPKSNENEFHLEHHWSSSSNGNNADGLEASPFAQVVIRESHLKPQLSRFITGETLDYQEGDILSDWVQSLKLPSFGSVILVPVVVHNSFWGFVIFGHQPVGETWDASKKSILKSFALCLGWEIKRHREDDLFQDLVQGTSSQTGDEFFKALVRHLALSLSAKCSYVYEVIDPGKALARVLSGWESGAIPPGEPLAMVDTPGEDVLAGMYSFSAESLEERFPDDKHLKEHQITSYAGVPFFDSGGRVMGLLAVMDDKAMVEKDRVLSILRLFASRAGAELERKRAEERIRNMAYHDPLTGLPNRILLSDRLTIALHQAHRNESMVAIMYLDFDNFKQINDSLGHPVGDQLLKEGAARLKNCLRDGDTIARLGGDEFILLFPEIRDAGHVASLALKINGVIKSPFLVGEEDVKTSVSIGIALFPVDGKDAKELMKNADNALFEAKRKGRDRFQFASTMDPFERNSA